MRFACVADCPEAMLGGLKACPQPEENTAWLAERNIPPPEDSGMVNGVQLPQYVLEELRLLAFPLSVYTQGELQAILAACAGDAHLIDDPNGVNLWDKMTLTWREEMEDKGKIDMDPWRGKPLHPLYPSYGFLDALHLQRDGGDCEDETCAFFPI